jgi:hypothetical protein
VLGPSEYQARAGVTTWANGVYWLEKVAVRPDGIWVVRNLTEGAKREVEAVTVDLEPDLLYPLLRGRDVRRWQAQPSAYILVTHLPNARLNAIPVKDLQTRYPKTWTYLKRFEKELRERSGFKRYFTRKQGKQVIETGPFYSIFNVGEYTFAPWKVVWRGEVATELVACVIGKDLSIGKCILADQTAYFVAFDDFDRAHYLCALLNSAIVRFVYSAFAYKHVSMGFIRQLGIPEFTSSNSTHTRLAALSHEAHLVAPAAYDGDAAAQARLAAIEAEIDGLAARLWGLTQAELKDIRQSLAELKGEDPEEMEASSQEEE